MLPDMISPDYLIVETILGTLSCSVIASNIAMNHEPCLKDSKCLCPEATEKTRIYIR